jgi:hypothetical protein
MRNTLALPKAHLSRYITKVDLLTEKYSILLMAEEIPFLLISALAR